MTETEPAADPRPVWNPKTSLAAVREAFATAADGIGGDDPEMLPHLLSPLVTTFHMQVDRLQGELEVSRRRLADAGGEADRAPLQAKTAVIEEKIEAFTQIADAAKEEYRRHTGQPWEPPEDDDAHDPAPAEPLHDAAATAPARAPEAEGGGEADPDPGSKIPF